MNSSPNSKSRHLLLIEDNAGDAHLLKLALDDSGVQHRLTVVDDGQDAADYLSRRGSFRDAQRPDLVVLDLNLPKKNGIEILREIRANKDIQRVPVLILSSSASERDINSAYDSGANVYLKKPSTLIEFQELIDMIAKGWLQLAALPSPSKN